MGVLTPTYKKPGSVPFQVSLADFDFADFLQFLKLLVKQISNSDKTHDLL